MGDVVGMPRSGRTRKQMEKAPHNAVFVWPNGALRYPTDLAHSIGRSDLWIISPDRLRDRHRFYGRELGGVVLDHATRLSAEQDAIVRELNGYFAARKSYAKSLDVSSIN